MKITLKLSGAALLSLRTQLECYLHDIPATYIQLLEQSVVSKLLKRKVSMFHYPKEVNILTLGIDEAVVIYRLLRFIDMGDIRINRTILEVIGRKVPENLINNQ